MPAPKNNKNAQRARTAASTWIQLRVTAARKRRYQRAAAAASKTLTSWACDHLDTATLNPEP